MKSNIRILLSIVSAFVFCNCSTNPSSKQLAPLISPVTGKPAPFTLRSVTGASRPSQVMAALERHQEDMLAERKSGRDPVSQLAKSLNVPNRTGVLTLGPTVESKTVDGAPITLFLPALAVDGGDIPPAELTKAMPDLQRYYFRALSRHMRPVDSDELMQKK